MGLFWDDPVPAGQEAPRRRRQSACPVKPSSLAAMASNQATDESKCPVKPSSRESGMNPLNRMFAHLSQAPAKGQTTALPTSRDPSSIPREAGGDKWEYPSPQQMYNALLRKGYHDTDIDAVEGMVTVHNTLNEGAWAEVVGWEKRFAGGLKRGLRICSKGEDFGDVMAEKVEAEEGREITPSLVRFHGRPDERTPKASIIQALGYVLPNYFSSEPPFDRHDWFVSREGDAEETRYVIDFYSAPNEDDGSPVFYLDVRPAFTLRGAAERAIRWSTDIWWRASGGEARLRAAAEAAAAQRK